jgi:hypothetical protein
MYCASLQWRAMHLIHQRCAVECVYKLQVLQKHYAILYQLAAVDVVSSVDPEDVGESSVDFFLFIFAQKPDCKNHLLALETL